MLKRVDRIILRVPQLESAVRYYRDTLGLKLLKKTSDLATFALDQSELVLHTDPDLPAEATYYLVDDVRDLYRRREELKLKFSGPPVPVARGFRATAKDPFGTVLLLLDRSTESASAATIENAKGAGAGSLFAGIEHKVPVKRDALIQAYEKIGRTADDLPYTPHFESLYASYGSAFDETKPTRQEVWRHLLNLRKAGKLPRMGEARSTPPDIDPDARARLREMLGEDIGKRDRLPYTKRFDTLVDSFNKSLPRRLSPHLVWRLVATLAK
ncbi:MAG TPA: VOC family protein [Tepidisphaeraceae bacterium]|jgi:catechol 2,3-dioxygenase-like lactoylglutathione lyase family enzyme